MSGRVGELSPKQNEALEKFRVNVRDILMPHHDDHHLLKWLRARDFDVTKAEMMFREALQWRKEIGANTILEEYQEIEVIEKYRTGGICGTDKCGCPVYIDPYGLIDMKGLLRSAKKIDILRKFVHVMEALAKLCQQESEKRGQHGKYVEEVVVIYDLNGLGITDLNMQSVSMFLAITELCQSRYPEMLKKIFVINSPMFFQFIWSLVKPLLHEKTAKKVVVVSGIYKDILLKQIDADQLPACYGGTKTDPDGDSTCKSLICQGGTIPRGYYKTGKPHEGMTAVTIGRASSIQIEFEVCVPNSKCRYEFLTEGHDIAFGVFRKTSTETLKASEMETILSTKRSDCHLFPEDGEVVCELPGKYVLGFDNTYSILRSKKVYYLLEVLKPDSTTQSSTSSDEAEDESLYLNTNGEKRYDVLPEEILNMDENALGIFKKALTYGNEYDRSIRLMIVGHAGVGKTTLSEHILGRSQNTLNPIESTNGIDVHIKRCKVQLDTDAWVPVNEDLYYGNLFQRLASILRTFSDNRREPKANDKREISDQKTSEPNELIYERVQVENPDTGRMSTSKQEFLEVIHEIQKLCTTVEKNACDVSIWDFAGQHVFYCTHQVFLSRRAIYLLVTDLSKHLDSDVQDECNVDCNGVKTCKLSEFITFWLNSIYTYCGAGETSSPFVIIVGTFADKLPKEKRKEMASKFFTALRETVVDTPSFGYLVDEDFDINNMIQDPRIDELKKKIVEVAKNQKWWHEEIPVKWVILERILRKYKAAGDKVLHRDILNVLNQQLTVPIDSEEEQELFLRFYHDTGIIMYFSDDSLRDFILLDPQWLVDAFKTLITAEKFFSKEKKKLQMWRDFRKTAILSMDFIDCLWKSKGNEVFWEHKSTLLKFMEKLGIIARPVSENLVDGRNRESKFFVPCMVKEAPPKDLIIRAQNKIEQCKITSILCFASKSNLLPSHLFNKLIAACICRWRTATVEGKFALFCGYAQFEMDDREHFLNLLFVNSGIQMWINRYSVSGKEEPDQQICAAAKIFIERKLYQEIKERYLLTVFWKCPKDNSNALENMIAFDELLKQKNQRCSVHSGCHVITPSELRFWIHNQGSLRSISCSDNVVGYPLRKNEDDTMSERNVHMLRESMKSVGLLIYKGQGLGTAFRVGSRFLMTAWHVVKTVVDLADSSNLCIDFNVSLLQLQTKRYHLTNLRLINEALDFVILEISDPDQMLPVALILEKDMNNVSDISSIYLIGYGHPQNQMEKILDPKCKLISPNSLQIEEAKQRLKKDKSTYRTALKMLGKDPDLVNKGYKGIGREGTLIFHCYMQHGASGAPAIAIHGLECRVVGMLTHAIPEFPFQLPDALKKNFEEKFLFEIASAMPTIYQCVISSEPQLAADIFI